MEPWCLPTFMGRLQVVSWPLCGALTYPDLHPRLTQAFGFDGFKTNRTPSMQGKFQAAGLFVSLAMALVGGIIVGEWKWLGQRRWGCYGLGTQEHVPDVRSEIPGILCTCGWRTGLCVCGAS